MANGAYSDTMKPTTTTGKPLNYTLELTKKLQRGEISPRQYARQRAHKVGLPDIVRGLLGPLYDFITR